MSGSYDAFGVRAVRADSRAGAGNIDRNPEGVSA